MPLLRQVQQTRPAEAETSRQVRELLNKETGPRVRVQSQGLLRPHATAEAPSQLSRRD